MEFESYDLALDVDFGRAFVRGRVRIRVKHPELPFELDSVGLQIEKVRVDGRPARFATDEKRGKLLIGGVRGRSSLVSIDYSKQISDDVIFGLYKSRYGNDYVLATDLEPDQARTVLPCKDEPSYKSIFRIVVTTQKGLKVISNSPLKRETRAQDRRVRFEFLPSPRMSTYLIFLGIGKFEERALRSSGVEIIAATRPGQTDKVGFVLDTTRAVLEDYGDYFGIPYPNKKLHIIALPEYHTGAMENWGAITSREAYMILGRNSGVAEKRAVASVMSHEVAHQWFGDLVTMKWWDDLWLNESFATLMGNKMVDRLHPRWNTWDDFLRYDTFASMGRDALRNTHPIAARVSSPAEIGQIFDAISYGKGASVLRMIEAYVGEESFRRGVSEYLKRFSFSNATGSDLWRSIERSSGQPVSRIMRAWVSTPGFPVVTVRYVKGRLALSQSLFRLDGRPAPGTWPIPLTMTLNGERLSRLFEGRTSSVPIRNLRSLLVNREHLGFYSVFYQGEAMDLVLRRFRSLSSGEKAGLLFDAYLFLLAGKISPGRFYDLVNRCCAETNRLVVRTVAGQLESLRVLAPESSSLRACSLKFHRRQVKRLGISAKRGEDEGEKVVREEVASGLVLLDDGFATDMARQFEDYSNVEPDMKATVALAYAVTGGEPEFERLVKMVKSLDSENDRAKIYGALCSFKDPRLVEEALELSIGGEVSRSDSAYTLASVDSNTEARRSVWRWVVRRYDKLWEIYGGSQQLVSFLEELVPWVGIGSEGEVKAFLAKKKEQGGMAFERSIERLEINSRLRTKLLA